MIHVRRALPAALLLALSACGGASAESGESPAQGGAGAPECRIEGRGTPLPAELRESSGVVASRRHAGVFWTHGDSGGEPAVVALRADGTVAGRVEVTGARNQDWEDVAMGPCPGGGDCLYLADTGDNRASRRAVSLWRVPEPAPGAARTAPALEITASYPGGPRDSEAMFVLPGGRAYLVSKGDGRPVELFRLPASGSGTMERVRQLAPAVEQPGDWVTGASASLDGRWVAVRTYGQLHLWSAAALLGGHDGPATTVDLAPLGEAQGEGVGLSDDGTVVLTSEGRGRKIPGTLSRLRCTLP